MADAKSQLAGYAVASIIDPALQSVGRFASQKLGGFLQGVHHNLAENAYKGLTDPVAATTRKDQKGLSPEAARKELFMTGDKWRDSTKMSAKGQTFRETGLFDDEKQSPTLNPKSGQWEMRATKAPSQDWQKVFFENPEATANAYGVAGTAIGIGATALAGQWISEQGKKPKSVYSAPVDPNPNVTAANVSYQNQAALEEQKFRHHMALQQAREQARIPGPQNTGVGSYGGGPYGSGSAHEHDVTSIMRGIYGSGMRL